MEHKLIKEFHDSGPCLLHIEEVNKAWDHRFAIFEDLYRNEYEFIKYLRRGSSCYDLKLTVSSEHAKEIIKQLGLVITNSLGCEQKYNFYRKPNFSSMDMRRKKKLKNA